MPCALHSAFCVQPSFPEHLLSSKERKGKDEAANYRWLKGVRVWPLPAWQLAASSLSTLKQRLAEPGFRAVAFWDPLNRAGPHAQPTLTPQLSPLKPQAEHPYIGSVGGFQDPFKQYPTLRLRFPQSHDPAPASSPKIRAQILSVLGRDYSTNSLNHVHAIACLFMSKLRAASYRACAGTQAQGAQLSRLWASGTNAQPSTNFRRNRQVPVAQHGIL